MAVLTFVYRGPVFLLLTLHRAPTDFKGDDIEQNPMV
jgi:hypothetical protein